jgi:hypothetical protein
MRMQRHVRTRGKPKSTSQARGPQRMSNSLGGVNRESAPGVEMFAPGE